MGAKLTVNGAVVCDLIPSTIHRLPLVQEQCWHDCVVVIGERVEPCDCDTLSIRTAGSQEIPFVAAYCRIGVEGWELAGKILY